MSKKPNVIYILADDMGYGDISAYNENCAFETVNYDKLCAEGIRFTDAHSTSAVCTPSRYGILTGRYNWRSRLKYGVLGGYSSALIEAETKTIGSVFQDCGYKTACIGKWHLGMDFAKNEEFVEFPSFAASRGVDYTQPIKESPIHRGFDYYYGIAASLDMPPYLYIENDHFTAQPTHTTVNTGKKFWREGPTGEEFKHEHVLDELTDKLLDQIEAYKEDPFFIYFPMPAPHTPILPGEAFQGKSGTNEYGDFVLHCDAVLGRIFEKLDACGLAEDTIVAFTSDNGCSPEANFAELEACGHAPNYIYRGHKADIYEGGHRIPYMIRWPAGIAAGQVCDQTVCLSDFMATMAQVLDYSLTDEMAVDSVSNLCLWQGEDAVIRENTVHQSLDGSLALRQGDWKLEMCPGCGGWEHDKVNEDYSCCPAFQLYHLGDDIREEHNVIEQHPDVFVAMKQELMKQVLDGRSTPGAVQKNHGEPIWETVQFLHDAE